MSVRPLSAVRGNLPAQASERFKARRRSRRRRAIVAGGILVVLLCAVAVYELHQPFVRISHIVVYGADQSLSTIAATAMQGSYLWVVPRDSTFFYPASRIRAEILATNPDFAAISLFRNGLTGLSIRVDGRTPIARWCGLAPTEGVEEYCYAFDASGLVYAAYVNSMQLVNAFRVYVPLEGNSEDPLHATIAYADKLPAVFDFARQLATFGSSVDAIVIRDGEVSNYLKSGTRVTFVLGAEQGAFTALVSARANLNLSDGSIEYVDLRFDGKVYLKRKGDTVP